MDFFQKVARMIVRAFEQSSYRKTVRELEKLSDKELNDIGLNRSMIRSIAYENHFDNR
jgi:uncharacterized protein YjiS (DUF1127 family)